MRKIALLLTLIVTLAIGMQAQTTQVTGQVLSEKDSEPIVGATVRVDGTTNATSTDLDGRFTLKGVKANAKKVTVTYVGFESKTVDIKPDMTIYIKETSDTLDEVLVVAFGKQKKEAFTGSATVVGAQTIERQQVVNPLDALNGNVTGLQMQESNSFSADPDITIRGIGSLEASTTPLIVLDGLPYNGNMSDINPADIASMTVLKDAASNALYGARGANGVILITTKSAQRGNTKVNFSARWGANSDGRVKYDYITDPGQYYEAHYQAMLNYYMNTLGQSFGAAHANANNILGGSTTEGGLGYMVYSVPENEFLIGTNGRLNPNAVLGNRMAYGNQVYTLYPDNWTDEGLRNGFRQEYNLSVSGGSERFTFLGSLGYLKADGLCWGNDIERYNAKMKADYQAFDWLKVGGTAGYTRSTTNSNMNVFYTIYQVGPIYPLYLRDGDGNIMTDANGRMYDYGSGDNAGCYRAVDPNGNLVQSDRLDKDRNVINAFNLQGYADFNFLKYFRLTVNGSAYITETRNQYGINPYYGYTVNTGGYSQVSHYRTSDINFQQLLDYNQSFGLNNVDVLLGHEYSRTTSTTLTGARNRVAMFNQNHELAGAVIDASMDSYITKYNVEGYFIRGQYDYDNRIFASFSFRRDGSSRFAKGHRWGNFWSLGGAWIISKESWFPQSPMVNMLKIKASYGEQGNDGIGDYRYIDTYTIKNSDGQVAYVFREKGNEDITWETVGSFNCGVEFNLFNNRLNGGLDFYVRNTKDMLMWFTSPYSVGYSGYYDNIGDIRNTGIELTLDGRILDFKNCKWNVGLNLTWERNRITYLPDDKKQLTVDGYNGYSGSSLFYGEGLPVYTWYLKQYAGVSEDGQSLFYYTDENGNKATTTIYDNGGYYTCGSALPDVFGGFHTTLELYGFDLNVQFNYSIGGKKFDSTYQSLMQTPYNSWVGGQLHKDILNAWTVNNTESEIPRWQYNDINSGSSSDRWLTDASYLSLRNITLGYTLPQQITRKAAMSKVRVYVAAENIYYWSKRKGFDPRMGALYGNYNSTSYYSFPMRAISGGVTIDF